ncbi:MAG: hypothetical protein IT355_07400 [Gemmatimonadaceae bacterium]|nr:hypothetical protein [Gemmatimonadaceae bacterium]
MNGPLGWGLALGAGLLVAWIAYPAGAAPRLRRLLMALRVVSVVLVLALLLDLAIGVARPPEPLVALDASASWSRSGDAGAWRAALDSARSASGGAAVLLFGDSVRGGDAPARPVDAASLATPLMQRAAARGERLVVVTDGALDDADALQQAMPGSRLVVIPVRPAADRAVVDLSAPAEGRVGDTVAVQVRIAASAAMPVAASVRWLLDGVVLAESPVPPLLANGEAVIEERLVVPAGDSVAVLRAALPAGADAQSRNDTIAVAFRRGARQRIVIVSTAPDADVRDVATALRASVSLPTDAYYRIAPGRWLRDGALLPVEESVVRSAVRGATLAVLHGDTTAMGAPGALGTRALLLLSPPAEDAPELLVRRAPASPLQAGLAGIVVESLPPLQAAAPARGGVVALTAAPGVTASGATPILSVIDGEVRRVVLTAAGYGRWRARGGVSEIAFQSVIGAATDWLLGARGRAAVPVPATPVVRGGTPLAWRRGAQPLSIVSLIRDGDRRTRRDSLRFGTAGDATMPALAEGVWRGTVDGAAVVIPVSASREWIPGAVTLRSGPLNGEARPVRRGARSVGWLYLAAVLLLAAEWLLRRRAGLR